MAEIFRALTGENVVGLVAGDVWRIDDLPAELDEVLQSLPELLWDVAVAAHLEGMKDAVRHQQFLQRDLLRGDGGGPVCPRCVTDGEAHLDELHEHTVELARQLAMVSVLYELTLVTG